jgi:two-component system OmpR family sensor kinase
MTLRTRITLLYVALLAASLLIIGGAMIGLLQGYLYRNLKTNVEATTLQVTQLLSDPRALDLLGHGLFATYLPGSAYAELDLIASPHPSAKDLPEELVPVERSLILQDSGSRIILSPNFYARLLAQKQGDGSAYLSTAGTSLHFWAQAELFTIQFPSPIGTHEAILIVAEPTNNLTSTLALTSRIYVLTALLVLVVGGLLADRLVRRTLEPLEWVTQQAESVSQRPKKLPEMGGNSEISALVRSLNRMMARLEEAWESQTRFLADASHELRTPITAILGHVSYLLRRTPLNEQQRESLETIQKEGQRMQKLVGDLLELSQSGNWKIQLGPVHLATLLNEVAEEYAMNFAAITVGGSSRERGGFELVVPEDLWVLGDPDRLHQVFANLVSNAQKAGASHIRLIAHDLGDKVVIRVEDNGEGIPPEHLPHLFERFYRVDKSRDRSRGGSGLGLAIVRSIVEAHQGQVWVESELGKGSCFSVSLKKAQAPHPEET